MDLVKLYTETLIFLYSLNQYQLSLIALVPLSIIILYQLNKRLKERTYVIELIVIGEQTNNHTIHKLEALEQNTLYKDTNYKLDLDTLYLDKRGLIGSLGGKSNRYIQLYHEGESEPLTFKASKQTPEILHTVSRSKALQNIKLGKAGFTLPDKRTLFIVIAVIVIGLFIYRYYQGGLI